MKHNLPRWDFLGSVILVRTAGFLVPSRMSYKCLLSGNKGSEIIRIYKCTVPGSCVAVDGEKYAPDREKEKSSNTQRFSQACGLYRR